MLDIKIMQNEAKYDLDRKAAKISALFSNNLDKYEYLIGKDLGLKPSNIEQAKFEFYPLGEIANKGLSKDDRKERIFKRLENIKDKNEEQLQAIKDQGEKQLLSEFRKIDEALDNAELICTKTDGTEYYFNHFLFLLKFIEKIHSYEITLDETRNHQTILRISINKLSNGHNPRSPKKAKEKNNALKSARKLLDARKYILVFLKKETFHIKVMYLKQKKKNQKKNYKETS